MPVLEQEHIRRILSLVLAALLTAGFVFVCPPAPLAAEAATINATNTSADGLFFIAKLTDSTVKPTSEQEVRQNLAGYSSRITVADALTDPETAITGGKVEEFDGSGVAGYLNALPANDQIAAACPEFNPDTQIVLWYVIKKEAGDGWHIDGLLLDKSAVTDGTDPGTNPDSGTTDPDPDQGTTDNGTDDGTDPGDNTPAAGNTDNGTTASTDTKPTPAKKSAGSSAEKSAVSAQKTALPNSKNDNNAPSSATSANSISPSAAAMSQPAHNAKPAGALDAAPTGAHKPATSAIAAAANNANTPNAAERANTVFPPDLATAMRITGAAGMAILAGAVLVAAALSAAKAASAKAFEEQLKSASRKSGGRR